MIVPDVNVLVYAFKGESPRHPEYRDWLERTAVGEVPLGLTGVVLSGFARMATNPAVFEDPSDIDSAMDFVSALRAQPASVDVSPGASHLSLFETLCRRTRARGNAVPDAYLAAITIDLRAELVTTDRGFARFPGLHSKHPLD
ncbi:MAG: TA system VapC family ribonuclease toxin [Actinomycetota bacterium]